MNRKQGNNSGISMMIVLGALIVVGFLAGAMIKLSSGGQLSNAFFSSSASARSAAQSGLTAAVSWLESPSKAGPVADMANGWRTGNVLDEHRKIVPATADGDGFIPLGTTGDQQRYRVTVLGFDIPNRTISLRCEGQGKGRSRAVVTALYKIEGLVADNGVIPNNALHLGGGTEETNRALIVNGGTYIHGGVVFTDNMLQQHQFNGPFYAGYKNGTTCLIKGAVFNGPVYFEGNTRIEQAESWAWNTGQFQFLKNAYNNSVKNPNNLNLDNVRRFTGLTEFNNGLGVERELSIGTMSDTILYIWATPPLPVEVAPFTVKGGQVLVNGIIKKASPTLKINMLQSNGSGGSVNGIVQGKDGVTHLAGSGPTVNTALADMFSNASASTVNGGITDIPAALNIARPAQVGVNLHSALMAKAQNISALRTGANPWLGGITAADMNDMYGDAVANNTCYVDEVGQKWLVLNYDQSSNGSPFSTDNTEQFNGRVVWICNSVEINADELFYQHASTGITVMYVGPNSKLTGMGGCNLFRGFIYTETSPSATTNNIYKALAGKIFEGAIYQKNDTKPFRLEGSPDGNFGHFTINYNQSLMNELRPLGILFDPNNVNAEQLKVKPGVGISASLVSQSM